MPSDFDRKHAVAKKMPERCGVCNGAHPSKDHKKHAKQAGHDVKADLHNWKARSERFDKFTKKDEEN